MKDKKIQINLQEKKAKTEKLIEDYKSFAIKGNVVDLAIGVVIGSAFTNIINTLVSSLVTPLLSIITNRVDLSTLFISLTGGHYDSLEQAKQAGAIVINYGSIINAVINFIIISIILFIFFRYISKLRSTKEEGSQQAVQEVTKTCPYCKSSVDKEATRCAHCTSVLETHIDTLETKEPKKKIVRKRKIE